MQLPLDDSRYIPPPNSYKNVTAVLFSTRWYERMSYMYIQIIIDYMYIGLTWFCSTSKVLSFMKSKDLADLLIPKECLVCSKSFLPKYPCYSVDCFREFNIDIHFNAVILNLNVHFKMDVNNAIQTFQPLIIGELLIRLWFSLLRFKQLQHLPMSSSQNDSLR